MMKIASTHVLSKIISDQISRSEELRKNFLCQIIVPFLGFYPIFALKMPFYVQQNI